MGLDSWPNINGMILNKDVNGLIKALKHENAYVRMSAASALGVIEDTRGLEALKIAKNHDVNKEVRDRANYSIKQIKKIGKQTKNFSTSKKIKRRNKQTGRSKNDDIFGKLDQWFSKKTQLQRLGIILVIIILVLSTSYIISKGTDSTQIESTTAPTSAPATTSPTAPAPTQNTETTTTTTNSDDYDRGYDEGYFAGINDAYSEWEYYDQVSSTLQVSDTWKQGYKEGYSQGYSDIQNDMPLQKPRIPGTAILDPRTGEEIYA